MQTVHLNIAWLSSDSKIYLAKRVAAKRTAQVTHRTIRSLVSKPDEHCGNLECPRKPTNLYSRSGPSKSSAPWCSFEAISIDRRRQRDPALARVSGSPLRSTAMSKRTREEKSAKPQQLAKPDAISIGRRFAQPYGKARLLIDHPHSYREWNIVGQCDVPGFFYLESRFRLNPGEQPATYTEFELCLHESQFERL